MPLGFSCGAGGAGGAPNASVAEEGAGGIALSTGEGESAEDGDPLDDPDGSPTPSANEEPCEKLGGDGGSGSAVRA